MSNGPTPGEQAGIYPIERIITVPLPGEPAARAAYSDNPGFTEGAEEAHPISSGKLSMFAEPQIVEALEAVRLYSSNGTGEFHLEAIDPETALGGLKWLRKNMASDSEVRRQAIEARESIEMTQHVQEERRRQAEMRAANHDAEHNGNEARARKLRHEAEVKEQLEGVFAGAPEMIGGVDLTNIIGLTEMLSSHDGEEGVVVDDNKAYMKALSKRIDAYMGDPGEMLKDFKALIACLSFTKSAPEGTYAIAQSYLDHTEIGLTDILSRASYVGFSDEVMDMWFDALAAEPAEPIYEGADTTWAYVAQEVIINTKVLSNTLIMTAKRDPYEYIDRLHAFADKGLDPDDQPRFNMTATAIAICLTNPMACIELNQASLAAEEGSDVQRQALDVRLALEAAGLSAQQIAGRQDHGKLSQQEMNLVCMLYPMNTLASAMGGRSIMLDLNKATLDNTVVDRFKAQALSPDGIRNTIFGRVSSASGGGLNLPRG